MRNVPSDDGEWLWRRKRQYQRLPLISRRNHVVVTWLSAILLNKRRRETILRTGTLHLDGGRVAVLMLYDWPLPQRWADWRQDRLDYAVVGYSLPVTTTPLFPYLDVVRYR